MWSTDLQHFLNDKGATTDLNPEASDLAEHFGAIVAAVTLDFTGRFVYVNCAQCRNPSLRDCRGMIIGVLGSELATIDWHCSKCDDSGVIKGWEGTLWDCSEKALAGLEVKVKG